MASLPAGKKILQTDLDEYEALTAAWSSYTPTITAPTANPTIGTSTIVGAYLLIGKTLDIAISLQLASGWAVGNGVYSFSWPPGAANALSHRRALGSAYMSKAGVISNGICLVQSSGNQLQALFAGALIGSATALASGDELRLAIRVQVA